MNRFWLCISVFTFISGMASASIAAELPLKRVTLSTSGLAQFEHQGHVTGDVKIALPVQLDDVDDVLKSLVVLDKEGNFAGVTLPGQEPLSRIFYDLPFDRNDLANPQNLLTALQGTDITISGPQAASGKLLSIHPETEITSDGATLTKHRIAILAEDGLHTVLLENLDTLAWSDPTIHKQLNDALTSIFHYQNQDQRQLTLDLRGTGKRPVIMSYVASAPLWKNAYRLVLPAEKTDKAYLQGWAILENTTPQDWKDVSITLVSGNPVTYRQALYESYYRERPFLPLRVMDQILPRTDVGAIPLTGNISQQDAKMEIYDGMPARAMPSLRSTAKAVQALAMDSVAPPPMGIASLTAEAPLAEEALAQLAFHFPQKITLEAGNSLMLPVIARDISAEQLWLYQPETNNRHPLTALALENDSETALPTGILTLFEQTENGLLYSGDSELSMLPKGEKRYVTFALDTMTLIDRETGRDRLYGAISVSKGVMRQSIISMDVTKYIIKAPAEESRLIVLEHPRRNGWTLRVNKEIEGDLEKTETHYRLKVKLGKGEVKTVEFTLEKKDFESISIGTINPNDLTLRLSALALDDLSPKAKKTFETLISLQEEAFSLNLDIQNLEKERQSIFNDQNRIRNNLTNIPVESDLAKDYLADLGTQESRLKTLGSEQSLLQERHREAQKKLSDYIARLEI